MVDCELDATLAAKLAANFGDMLEMSSDTNGLISCFQISIIFMENEKFPVK